MRTIGILVAQKEESQPLVNRLLDSVVNLELQSQGKHIIVEDTGVGMMNAMHHCYKMYHDYHPDIIINIGTSAGRGNLSVGDIVYVDRVYNGDFDISVFNHNKYYVPEVGDYIHIPKHGKSIDSRYLPCFSFSRFIESPVDTDIKDYVIDMEYYSIAYACIKLSIPTMSIKVISDDGNHSDYESNLYRCSNLLAMHMLDLLKVL